jgi:hypothetical protein
MSDKLLTTYLEHIRRAAADANNFIEGNDNGGNHA